MCFPNYARFVDEIKIPTVFFGHILKQIDGIITKWIQIKLFWPFQNKNKMVKIMVQIEFRMYTWRLQLLS